MITPQGQMVYVDTDTITFGVPRNSQNSFARELVPARDATLLFRISIITDHSTYIYVHIRSPNHHLNLYDIFKSVFLFVNETFAKPALICLATGEHEIRVSKM